MFDSGIMEWLVVAVVALLVLGPERALAAMKMAGLMLGKAKAAVADVQQQVEKDLPMAEVQLLKDNVQALRPSNVKKKVVELAVGSGQG
ncbi:twin-arginine translocase TatA/TatE family subunit [Pseudomonas saliphila]|uniref:twin-arginine translocase TatA/TatE family subunit n=1 Tax=Pseudomonas saliphila TaxID=2586906 RepID=UPI001238AFCE|nr:twin-arginine translocase TatA/TatE family subunit [Pseudomonas saliphila]